MRARNNRRRSGGSRRAAGRRSDHRSSHSRPRRNAIGLELLEARRVLSAAGGIEAAAALDPATFAADRVLVKFRQPVTPPFTVSATSAGAGGSLPTGSLPSLFPTTLASILDAHGATAARKVFPSAPRTSGLSLQSAGASVAADSGDEVPDATSVGLDRWYSFDLSPGSNVATVLAALAADGAVEAAEPDYLFKLSSLLDGQSGGGPQGDASIASLPSAETDPAYGQQWHLGAVKAPEAWAHLESLGLPAGGRSDIVIAVIDTGVDYTHPDLAANMWVNTAEIPGNGIDDDGNGFVDDIHGVAVVSDSGSHSGDPADDHGHGTHVAGIAAASGDNDIGGVGIAYNAKIMGIKAFQYSGMGTSTDIAEAIYYAVENGADIINMSFGSYSESTIVKDALQVAFGTSVLVAAAGNDGRGNLSCPPWEIPPPANMYPAAYNWVLGVMASTPQGGRAPFSNKDCLPNDAHEYELLAPGAGVYSTLPGGTYSAWSGTSMAAPVVSGIAALLRTKFADKGLYSSRFIMGQLAVGRGGVIDAARNLTDTPRPNLTYRNHFLFDTTTQAAANDADGRVDAGETVDLAVTIRNHWGRADNVTVTLDAFAEGAIGPDPYVTMITDTVHYGAVGTFSEDDNGLIYNSGGVVTGVTSPFRFSVAANTPNEHVIPFRLTITAANGLDPADQTVYTFTSRLTMTVQRGRELPSVITEDMVLTKENFWIVGGPVLIPAGVTVRIDPGTQVQWGVSESLPYQQQRFPYIKVEGTLNVAGAFNEPVQLFPSEQFREVNIRGAFRPNVRIYNFGTTTLDFATVTAPELSTDRGTERHLSPGVNSNGSAHRLNSITRSILRGENSLQHAKLYYNDNSSRYEYSGQGFAFAAEEIRETLIDIDSGLEEITTNVSYSIFRESLFAKLQSQMPGSTIFALGAEMRDSVFLGTHFPEQSNLLISGDNPAVKTTPQAAIADVSFRSNAVLNSFWNRNAASWLLRGASNS